MSSCIVRKENVNILRINIERDVIMEEFSEIFFLPFYRQFLYSKLLLGIRLKVYIKGKNVFSDIIIVKEETGVKKEKNRTGKIYVEVLFNV